MKYFKKFINKLGYIYSLDMIRLNFEFKNNLINSFTKLLQDYNILYNLDIKTYIGRGVGYHYLYNIKLNNEFSFAIGLELNCKSENKNKGFIEFNPNKCLINEIFSKFWEEFKKLCFEIKLKRYDCAIDILIKREYVKLIRNFKCNYEYLYITDEDNGSILNRSVTEYQGRRNHNKFTKLYNKTAESKLDYDLTRIEFTFDREEVNFENLPLFFIYHQNIINELYNNNFNQRDFVLIDLLRNSDDINFYLKRLNYRYREKIKPALYDYILHFEKDNLINIRNLALSFEL